MQRGPKKTPTDIKKAIGTFRPCRDNPTVPIETSRTPPIKPNYLTEAAEEVWDEELERVVAAGTSELDSSLFADYCSLAATCRVQFQSGDTPQSARLSELRKMRELLGIGGAPSRAQRGTAKATPTNAFASLSKTEAPNA